MPLLESAGRLAVVIALVAWLPGWIVSGPFRPIRILYPLILGVGVLIAVLAGAGLVTSRIDSIVRMTPGGVAAVSVSVWLWRRFGSPSASSDFTLPAVRGWLTVAMASIVAAAAVLRWFHNYHFDDFQHLLYLTEVDRLNEAFPAQFKLSAFHLSWPAEGMLMVSRYPYWAMAYVVLGRLAGIPLGDAYFFLGLALLALTLGTIAVIVQDLLSSRTAGVIAVVVLLAATPVLSDNFLNYGGYPFQTGKLFVFLTAVAGLGYLQSGRREYLWVSAVSAVMGPLLHTNNVIGISVVLVVLAAVALTTRREKRRPSFFAAAAMSVTALVMITVLGLASRGFIDWNSGTAEQPTTVGETLSRAGSTKTFGPEDIAPRIALFVARGTPGELLVVGLALLLYRRSSPFGMRRVVTTLVLSTGIAVLVASSGSELARQIVTTALKPGYLPMRSQLMAAGAATRGANVVTDGITFVLGNAAGWGIRDAVSTRLDTNSQRWLLLIFHPRVQGPPLVHLLNAERQAFLVINEGVLGPGTASKFDRADSVTRLMSSGTEIAAPERLVEDVSATLRRLLSMEYSLDPRATFTAAHALWRALFNRPIVVFSLTRAGGAVSGADERQAAMRLLAEESASTPAMSGTLAESPFLDADIVRLAIPAGCFGQARVTVANVSPFGNTVQIVAVTNDGPVGERTQEIAEGDNPLMVDFNRPQCGPADALFFVHGGYLYDYRFAVRAIQFVPVEGSADR